MQISLPRACLAFLDANRVRVPACTLHAEPDDVRPFLAVRVYLVHGKLLEHFTLSLQLVQLPLIFLGGHLSHDKLRGLEHQARTATKPKRAYQMNM